VTLPRMTTDITSREVVRYEIEGRCAVITIDRAEARNAISPEVALGIEAALDSVEGDPEVWAAVLTGVAPVFCAGADLRAIDEGRGELLSTARGGFAGVTRRERTKPLIAAVEGAALAGGTEIVLSCDLVVAAEGALFGIPEVKRGLVAAAGGLFRLGTKLPPTVAMECALTGDPIDAATAHRFGMVNRLAAPGGAREAALDLASRVTANAPLAVAESRKIVSAGVSLGEEAGWELTEAANQVVLASEDVHEGIQAFIEKRPPAWKGR
jgi:enoyl-CoA hydratase